MARFRRERMRPALSTLAASPAFSFPVAVLRGVGSRPRCSDRQRAKLSQGLTVCACVEASAMLMRTPHRWSRAAGAGQHARRLLPVAICRSRAGGALAGRDRQPRGGMEAAAVAALRASPKDPNSPLIRAFQELLRLPLPALEPLLFSLTQPLHRALLLVERFAMRGLCRTLRSSGGEPQRK
jgi:hypothetical protein